MRITRKAEFSASHFCYRADWTEQQNRSVYGESANRHGHGHNYLVEVTLEGTPDPVTGMVLDLKQLKAVIHEEVVEPFDHKHLNHEVAPFNQIVPTTENIVHEIWQRLVRHYPGGRARLYRIRLWETADIYVDYYGGDAA
jgi:6-pyruvoyltetrahydropterin/6-carboxytetrahydropterin synthase